MQHIWGRQVISQQNQAEFEGLKFFGLGGGDKKREAQLAAATIAELKAVQASRALKQATVAQAVENVHNPIVQNPELKADLEKVVAWIESISSSYPKNIETGFFTGDKHQNLSVFQPDDPQATDLLSVVNGYTRDDVLTITDEGFAENVKKMASYIENNLKAIPTYDHYKFMYEPFEHMGKAMRQALVDVDTLLKVEAPIQKLASKDEDAKRKRLAAEELERLKAEKEKEEQDRQVEDEQKKRQAELLKKQEEFARLEAEKKRQGPPPPPPPSPSPAASVPPESSFSFGPVGPVGPVGAVPAPKASSMTLSGSTLPGQNPLGPKSLDLGVTPGLNANASKPAEKPADPAASTKRDKIFDETVCSDKNGVLESNGVSIDPKTRDELLKHFTLGTDNQALATIVEESIDAAQIMDQDKRVPAYGTVRSKRTEAIRDIFGMSNASHPDKIKANFQLLAAAFTSAIKEYEAHIVDHKNAKALDEYNVALATYNTELAAYEKQQKEKPSDFATTPQLVPLRPTKPTPPITTGHGINADTLHNARQSVAAFTSLAQMANIQKSLSENGAGLSADPSKPYAVATALFGGEGKYDSGDKHQAAAYNNSEAVFKKLYASDLSDLTKKQEDLATEIVKVKSRPGYDEAVVKNLEQKQEAIKKEISKKQEEEKRRLEEMNERNKQFAATFYKPLKPNGMSGEHAISNKGFFDTVMGSMNVKWSGTENAEHLKAKIAGITFGHKRGVRHTINDDGSVTSFFSGLSRREIELGRPRTMSKLTKQMAQVYALGLSFGGAGSSPKNPMVFGTMDPPEGKVVQFAALLVAAKNSGRTSYVEHEGVIYEVPADAMTRDLSKIFAVDKEGNPVPSKTLKDLSTYCAGGVQQAATSVNGKQMLSLAHSRFMETMKIRLVDVDKDGTVHKHDKYLSKALTQINEAMKAEVPPRELTYDQLMAIAVDGGSLTYGNPAKTVQMSPTDRSYGLNTWRISAYKDSEKLEARKAKAVENSKAVLNGLLGADEKKIDEKTKEVEAELTETVEGLNQELDEIKEILESDRPLTKLDDEKLQSKINAFNDHYHESIGPNKIGPLTDNPSIDDIEKLKKSLPDDLKSAGYAKTRVEANLELLKAQKNVSTLRNQKVNPLPVDTAKADAMQKAIDRLKLLQNMSNVKNEPYKKDWLEGGLPNNQTQTMMGFETLEAGLKDHAALSDERMTVAKKEMEYREAELEKAGIKILDADDKRNPEYEDCEQWSDTAKEAWEKSKQDLEHLEAKVDLVYTRAIFESAREKYQGDTGDQKLKTAFEGAETAYKEAIAVAARAAKLVSTRVSLESAKEACQKAPDDKKLQAAFEVANKAYNEAELAVAEAKLAQAESVLESAEAEYKANPKNEKLKTAYEGAKKAYDEAKAYVTALNAEPPKPEDPPVPVPPVPVPDDEDMENDFDVRRRKPERRHSFSGPAGGQGEYPAGSPFRRAHSLSNFDGSKPAPTVKELQQSNLPKPLKG